MRALDFFCSSVSHAPHNPRFFTTSRAYSAEPWMDSDLLLNFYKVAVKSSEIRNYVACMNFSVFL